MSKIYYYTKYFYITSIELDFLVKLSHSNQIGIIIQDQKFLTNKVYLITIRILLCLENFMQSKFSISRNYQPFKLVNLKNSTFNKEVKSKVSDGKIFFLTSNGFYIADQFSFDIQAKKLYTLADKMGGDCKNKDQIKVDIYVGLKNKFNSILTAHYENDRLFLNRNVICIRRIFHHAINTKNLF